MQRAILKRKLKTLEKQLRTIGPVMRGSIVLLMINCGNRNCKCYKKKDSKHPAYYFSVNMNNKTKLIYLGEKRLKDAKRYNDNYMKLWNIINQMTNINLDLLKNS